MTQWNVCFSQCRFILLSAGQPGEVTSGAHSSCLKAGKCTKAFQLRQEVSLLKTGLYSRQALIHPSPSLAIPSSAWARATTLNSENALPSERLSGPTARLALKNTAKLSGRNFLTQPLLCKLFFKKKFTWADKGLVKNMRADQRPYYHTSKLQLPKAPSFKTKNCPTATLSWIHTHPEDFHFLYHLAVSKYQNSIVKWSLTEHSLSDWHSMGKHMLEHSWHSPNFPVCA